MSVKALARGPRMGSWARLGPLILERLATCGREFAQSNIIPSTSETKAHSLLHSHKFRKVPRVSLQFASVSPHSQTFESQTLR